MEKKGDSESWKLESNLHKGRLAMCEVLTGNKDR